tara:strand:+ start:32 stop:325 length:294 start_codon:yes stop_codon:yes gene_type:complete
MRYIFIYGHPKEGYYFLFLSHFSIKIGVTMKPKDKVSTYFESDSGSIIIMPLEVLEVHGNVCSCINLNTQRVGLYSVKKLQAKNKEVQQVVAKFNTL